MRTLVLVSKAACSASSTPSCQPTKRSATNMSPCTTFLGVGCVTGERRKGGAKSAQCCAWHNWANTLRQLCCMRTGGQAGQGQAFPSLSFCQARKHAMQCSHFPSSRPTRSMAQACVHGHCACDVMHAHVGRQSFIALHRAPAPGCMPWRPGASSLMPTRRRLRPSAALRAGGDESREALSHKAGRRAHRPTSTQTHAQQAQTHTQHTHTHKQRGGWTHRGAGTFLTGR